MFGKPRATKGERLRVFFATDLHGSETCFRKFLNARDFYGVDLLILGGDLAGKSLIPIVATGNDAWDVTWLDRSYRLDSRDALAALQSQIRGTGCYDLVVSPEEHLRMGDDESYLSEMFMKVMKSRLEDWVALADERLPADAKCYTMLGNDDPDELARVFTQSSKMVNGEDLVIDLPGDYQLASCGLANTTPWNMPRDAPESVLKTRIDAMGSQLKDPERAIFSFHAPPVDTELDQAPMLDQNLKPVTGAGGNVVHTGVGSVSVRERIDFYQPLLSLHGHIHECSAMTSLGRTVSINPGSEYEAGVLRGAIVELRGRAEPRWQLVQG